MFCPKCKCDYREGFLTCSVCGADLVDDILKEEQCGCNRTVNKLSYIFEECKMFFAK